MALKDIKDKYENFFFKIYSFISLKIKKVANLITLNLGKSSIEYMLIKLVDIILEIFSLKKSIKIRNNNE